MTGAIIFGCAGTVLSAEERAFFRDADPWGFILFARNIEKPGQVLRLTAALRESVGRDAPILIDQEGGRVQRLRAPHWTEWPPALDTALSVKYPERAFWLQGRLMAAELRGLGIDTDCAPCCDIAYPETHPFLRNRCMGTDVDSVVYNARAMAAGLLDGGVLPVIKHVPGHGRAQGDSHLALPEVTATAEELDRSDFEVFRRLKDLPLAMTSHLLYRAFDDRPATQSGTVIRLIREKIGFGGLLMSDDIGMEALSGDAGSRAGAAIAAGCDAVLHCNGTLDEMIQSATAAGAMNQIAVSRADAALARRKRPSSVDIEALAAEAEQLSAQKG